MKTRHTLIAAALAAILGGLVVPALAEAPGGSQMIPNRDMATGHRDQGMSGGMTGGAMMSDGMMSGGMMGGCMGMMQSINHGTGRPNGQWQKHSPGDRSMN